MLSEQIDGKGEFPPRLYGADGHVKPQHYGSVDKIEYYPRIFCEDVRENSALAPLIGIMVGADAFSQALPNPLLQSRVWNKDTFSLRGWGHHSSRAAYH